MRMIGFVGFSLISLFLIIGCGKSNSDINSTVQEGAAGGNIIVHVSDGQPSSQPIYTWEDSNNDTTAEEIAVAKTSDLNTIVWGVHSSNVNNNDIPSPRQQGKTGGFDTAFVTTEITLQSNIEYRVTITKAGGTPSGFRNFTITQ